MTTEAAQLKAPDSRARIDLETRVKDDDHQAVKVWLRLLASTNRIESELRARFRKEFGTTLARFDLMAQLERHPAGLKMTELSQRMMVTGGNVTGLTDQLEKERLVVREADPNDRRACSVRLTAEGRELFDRMAAVHEQWVVELLSGLKSADKDSMYQLLGRLKAHTNLVVHGSSIKRGGANE
jgi:DNA-binding MarR family transcriptional regulator